MARAALLVIDLQRWFLETGPPAKLRAVEALIAATNELLDAFHERRLPVVIVQTVHQADGSTWNQWMKAHDTGRLIEGTPEAELHPALRTAESDLVLTKTRHSCFIRTDLERMLRDRDVDTVVLAGFSTNLCVGLTAIEAWERDFRVFLAGEAILGTDPEAGELMLNYLRKRFEFEPISNAEILEAAGRAARGSRSAHTQISWASAEVPAPEQGDAQMLSERFDPNDPEQADRFRAMFGPHQVDQLVRQAIQFCWMALPADKRNVDEVERNIRRLVDRALRDLREDDDAFGLKAGDD